MTARNITVIGEALVDLVPDTSGEVHAHIGGGPFNVARAVGRLGGDVTFLCRVSTDAYGDRLARALADDGVTLPPALRDPAPTALAIAELDALGQASYRFELQDRAAAALTPDDIAAHAPAVPAALYAGGLGLVMRPIADATEALLDRLAGRSLVFVDPNVRPAAIDDMAAYRARLDRVFAQANVIKVSDADLAILMPELDAEAAARSLLDGGADVVLLTLGEHGAVALGAFGQLAVAAPPTTVVDTVGAGDAFSGAWIARWLQADGDLGDADQVAEVTAFAVRAAAWNCERAGASPLSLAEMEARLG